MREPHTDTADPAEHADPAGRIDPAGTGPSTSSWRRAFTADLRLNAHSFVGTGVLALLSLVLAALVTDVLSQLAFLWAALAWYRYGRDDTGARTELWASLGLSRADRIRGRIALVGLDSTVLVLVGALGSLLTHLARREPTFRGDTFAQGPLAIAVLGSLLFTVAMLLVIGAIVGGECTMRRPGTSMVPITILASMGAGLLTGILSLLLLLPLQIALGDGAALTWCTAGIGAVLCVLGALFLRHEARKWIRALDSGERHRREMRRRSTRTAAATSA